MANNLVWQNLLAMDFDSPELRWQSFRPQVDILFLHGDASQNCSCALLRYQPGARIPRHLHLGVEFLFILRGSQADERGHYAQGSFLINPASSSHAIVSEEGCIVLAIWERPVQFV